MSGILSKDSIIVNGINSNTIGLYIDTPPVPPVAQQRYTEYQTGADTDGVSLDDTFENIRLTVTAYQFFTENFDNRIVYNFLKDAKTLQTSRFSDYLYRVQKLSVSNPESSYDGRRIRYQITFDCRPFKYSVENPMENISAGTVTNSGSRYSQPIWAITGTGDVSLIVNSAYFTIAGLDGTAVVDCEKMIAYTQNEIINPRTTGNFPFLAVGDNSVSWNGEISRVALQKNERWY